MGGRSFRTGGMGGMGGMPFGGMGEEDDEEGQFGFGGGYGRRPAMEPQKVEVRG